MWNADKLTEEVIDPLLINLADDSDDEGGFNMDEEEEEEIFLCPECTRTVDDGDMVRLRLTCIQRIWPRCIM